MAKTIETWAVFLGFLLGIAYNKIEQLFQRDEGTTVLEVMLTWEYRTLIILIAGVLLLSIIFYFIEKNVKEVEEHNRDIYYQAINSLITNVKGLSTNVEALINEIRADRNERNNKSG